MLKIPMPHILRDSIELIEKAEKRADNGPSIPMEIVKADGFYCLQIHCSSSLLLSDVQIRLSEDNIIGQYFLEKGRLSDYSDLFGINKSSFRMEQGENIAIRLFSEEDEEGLRGKKFLVEYQFNAKGRLIGGEKLIDITHRVKTLPVGTTNII